MSKNIMKNPEWFEAYGSIMPRQDYEELMSGLSNANKWKPSNDLINKIVKSFEEHRNEIIGHYPISEFRNFSDPYEQTYYEDNYLKYRLENALGKAKDISEGDKFWGKRYNWPKYILDKFRN